MSTNGSCISLFSGAGGLDFGFEAAGFETRVALEKDKWCCSTIRANRDWPVIENEIENTTVSELLTVSSLSKGDADILIGGPPCQPFSKSGYWATGDSQRLSDPRAQTLYEYIRMLEGTLPKVFLLENVYGIAYEGKNEGLLYLQSAIDLINKKCGTKYTFNWAVLNSADYGVPQIRERVFIIGSRDGKTFSFPEPRFRSSKATNASLNLGLYPELPLYRTVWDAIGDLIQCDSGMVQESKIGGKWGDLLPTIPPGENYLYHTDRGSGEPIFKWRSRYWSFLLKLHPTMPSWTIQAQPGSSIGPFHWENRRLTMKEMARIQTFPDDVDVLGGITQIQKQIGNAVPSALAETLALEIQKQFLGDHPERSATLVPDVRENPPIARWEKKVPSKYLEIN